MTVTAAIVPAAGRGERLGPGLPKALRLLGGSPILVHAIRALTSARSVTLVVVAAPPDDVDEVRALLKADESDCEVRVIAGGDTRQDSVARALQCLPEAVDVVLVHDAARPLVPPELVDAVTSAVRSGACAVVPGGRVVETPDRSSMRAIQTPQGFDRQVLQAAHAAADLDDPSVTDDAGLVERLGQPVLVIPGHEEAFKVTRPLDLVLAEAILARRRASGAGA